MTRRPTEDDIRLIYRETIDGLFGFVSRRCAGNRELAEDITQETWLRAIRTWRADGIPERPLAWLCTVAGRLLSNHRRRASPEALDSEIAAPDDVGARDRLERRSLIERTLARLPALQHRLLEAFHLDGRPVAEIARDLGITERGVEGRLRRARQRLRRIIETDPELKETR